ncbi:MAG: ATP-binding cassette domain-containing protein [Prevotella sp.]|nr:ATP-binding cassette domain-containing protein [Prevotella sp.]
MLEVKDATIRVGDKSLMSGLSFIAKDGQMTCVKGSSGSGKSALIRTLMGFLPVGEGFVSVDGELLTIRSASAFRQMMTYLPQNMQLLRRQLYEPEYTDGDDPEYGVWDNLLPEIQEETKAEPLTPEEIFSLAEKTLKEGGEKPIVIADEPAAMLTPEFAERMLALLLEQARMGKTVVVVSRRPEIIANADKVIEVENV